MVRHGQTNWGQEDLLKGPQDLSLNEIGVQQAYQAGLVLKDLLHHRKTPKIVVSPLKRALQTAEQIAHLTDIPIVSQEEGLKERYYGDYRLVSANASIPPDAESTAQFQKRVLRTLLKILLQETSADPLVLVAHQKVFEYMAEFLTSRQEKLPQGGIAHFMLLEDGNWYLELIPIQHP